MNNINTLKKQKAFKIPVIQPLYKTIPIGSEEDDNKVKSDLEKPKRIKKETNENKIKFFINL
jgi:hypothetical protein